MFTLQGPHIVMSRTDAQNGLDFHFNILREIIENNFPFRPEFGHPLFILGASQDACTPFWLKACTRESIQAPIRWVTI